MIKNLNALQQQYPKGKVLLQSAEQALEFLQPERLIKQHVQVKGGRLLIQGKVFHLNRYKHVYIIGAGKATYQMATSMHALLRKHITSGYINVPKAITRQIGPITVNQAGHPFPNAAGVNGAQHILQLAEAAEKDDLIICLMSGGGSALLPALVSGLTLADKQKLTKALLQSSATIHEINTVRKHISLIKGGRLAQAALPATMVSLYISDVVGDDLDMIASGPTVPDSTTSEDALAVLQKYKIRIKNVETAIKQHETPKQLNQKKIYNFIVGNNQQVLQFLQKKLSKRFRVQLLTSRLQGEAREVARVLLSIAEESSRVAKKSTILLAGGETTVTVRGNGAGGRNQELVISALPYLESNMTILSLATDGVDGITPTPVAGAIADYGTAQRCIKKQLSVQQALEKNDSYHLLHTLKSILRTGPTGTNVGDIIMILIK